MIAESLRLADEIGLREQQSILLLNDEEQEQSPQNKINLNHESNEFPPDIDEDENAGLVAEEEAKIAQKLQVKTKAAGNALNYVLRTVSITEDYSTAYRFIKNLFRFD